MSSFTHRPNSVSLRGQSDGLRYFVTLLFAAIILQVPMTADGKQQLSDVTAAKVGSNVAVSLQVKGDGGGFVAAACTLYVVYVNGAEPGTVIKSEVYFSDEDEIKPGEKSEAAFTKDGKRYRMRDLSITVSDHRRITSWTSRLQGPQGILDAAEVMVDAREADWNGKTLRVEFPSQLGYPKRIPLLGKGRAKVSVQCGGSWSEESETDLQLNIPTSNSN